MLNVTKKMMFVALALIAMMVFVPAALANGPVNGINQPDSPMIGRGNGQGQRQGNQDERGPNYVDEDGDGVCDNCDGDCPHDGSGNQGDRGPNYTDEDGDGVCDNCDGDCDGERPQDGTGQKRGQGRR